MNDNSGFAVFAGMSRPRENPIMYIIPNDGNNLRECAEDLKGDALSKFANNWSGL